MRESTSLQLIEIDVAKIPLDVQEKIAAVTLKCVRDYKRAKMQNDQQCNSVVKGGENK